MKRFANGCQWILEESNDQCPREPKYRLVENRYPFPLPKAICEKHLWVLRFQSWANGKAIYRKINATFWDTIRGRTILTV